jgi:hypothetical protein
VFGSAGSGWSLALDLLVILSWIGDRMNWW